MDIDVLFTDINLGGVMDGAQLAKLAREMRPGLPIVYASGRRSVNDIATVPDSVFLPKPYSLNQVDQTLAQIGARD
jgi:DNA-binding LytR/AlgR family response regulator